MLFHPTPSKVSPIYPYLQSGIVCTTPCIHHAAKAIRLKCRAGIELKSEVLNMERELKKSSIGGV